MARINKYLNSPSGKAAQTMFPSTTPARMAINTIMYLSMEGKEYV